MHYAVFLLHAHTVLQTVLQTKINTFTQTSKVIKMHERTHTLTINTLNKVTQVHVLHVCMCVFVC